MDDSSEVSRVQHTSLQQHHEESQEETSISIAYISHKVILKRDSQVEYNDSAKTLIKELKDIENIQVHPNITFYVLITLFLIAFIISVSVVIYFHKYIGTILRRRTVQLPITNDNQIYPKLPAATSVTV